jgi:outer membrane protein assembly factor BamB
MARPVGQLLISPRYVALGLPAAAALLAVLAMAHWLLATPRGPDMPRRVPGEDLSAKVQAAAVDLRGTFVAGEGLAPEGWEGAWLGFRGLLRDNISTEPVRLAADWAANPPRRMWEIEVGDGYSGAAIWQGRAYVLDYDAAHKQDVLRCLSLRDGKDIWQRAYKVPISRNHGITRTVCAVADGVVVSIGPKCHILCLDALTGDFKWGIDLAREYKTTVPPWYTGQNPLLDEGRLIVAPGGTALMMAVELATGNVVWQTPNPQGWEMTHSSVVAVPFHGRKLYVYCASAGVVGVWSDTGAVAFTVPEWKVSMANVPSPLPLPEDRLLLTGGYGAGAMMVKLEQGATADQIAPRILFRLPPSVFGSEQHTPIFHGGYVYGVLPVRSELACLDLDGKLRWTSGARYKLGLGAYVLADGALLAISDTGLLMRVAATPERFELLTQWRVFEDGDECWGPIALAGGRAIVRDMTRMVCLDLRQERTGEP